VTIKIEGISEVLQRKTSSNYKERAQQRALLPPQAQAVFSHLVARIRERYVEEKLQRPDARSLDQMIVGLRALGY
jgi:hypothetical protein